MIRRLASTVEDDIGNSLMETVGPSDTGLQAFLLSQVHRPSQEHENTQEANGTEPDNDAQYPNEHTAWLRHYLPC